MAILLSKAQKICGIKEEDKVKSTELATAKFKERDNPLSYVM